MGNENPWGNTIEDAMGALFSHYMSQPQSVASPQQMASFNAPGPAVDLPVFNTNPYGGDVKGDNGVNIIRQLAQSANVDPNIATKVFGAESSFGRDQGPSRAGAIGPMQTMPTTLTDPGYGVKPAIDNSQRELSRVGVDYLGAMNKKFGNYNDALMAYNWGPGNVNGWIEGGRNLNSVPQETRNYIGKIMGAGR